MGGKISNREEKLVWGRVLSFNWGIVEIQVVSPMSNCYKNLVSKKMAMVINIDLVNNEYKDCHISHLLRMS